MAMTQAQIDAENNYISSGASVRGTSYTYAPNGTGGVNYFADGIPITREVFASNTGSDVGALEAQAAQDYANANATQNTGSTSGGSTSGGSTTAQYSPEALASILATHKQNVANINAAYGAGLFSYEQQNNALEQNRQDLITQLQQNQNANQAYFSNVSPDAYQSQQGNYNDNILQSYNTSNNNLTNQQTAIDQALASLAPTEQQALNNESSSYNANYTPYGAAAVNDTTLSPTYSGGTSSAIPTLTPVTMANVGASLSPYSPNGLTGNQGTQTSKAAVSPIDQYLSGTPSIT